MKLDVGCGSAKQSGWIGMDMVRHEQVDIFHDLRELPWPVETDSVDELRMANVIEHLPDTIGTFNEIHRILKPGGTATLSYPWYKSYGAYGDPTHVHYFNDRMIQYFQRDRVGGKYRYTDNFFKVHAVELTTYAAIQWIPKRILKLLDRTLGFDLIHMVTIVISPD